MGQQVLKVDFRPWGNAGARQHSCRAEESGARSQNPEVECQGFAEPGWLIDASGVLGEPALPRGLPRLAVISG